MQPSPKKENAPNFNTPSAQQAYVQDAQTAKNLLQKELDVNQTEQTLLQKRVQLMKEFINDLPASDPQYSMVAVQIQMDQVEMDELKTRETLLIQKIEENG
jgi:hypothetical protein